MVHISGLTHSIFCLSFMKLCSVHFLSVCLSVCQQDYGLAYHRRMDYRPWQGHGPPKTLLFHRKHWLELGPVPWCLQLLNERLCHKWIRSKQASATKSFWWDCFLSECPNYLQAMRYCMGRFELNFCWILFYFFLLLVLKAASLGSFTAYPFRHKNNNCYALLY